jgi:hypothetical protein
MDFDEDLPAALDPAQTTAATSVPLPRRRLGRGVTALLVVLRVYVLVALPIVGYAFVHALLAGP